MSTAFIENPEWVLSQEDMAELHVLGREFGMSTKPFAALCKHLGIAYEKRSPGQYFYNRTAVRAALAHASRGAK